MWIQLGEKLQECAYRLKRSFGNVDTDILYGEMNSVKKHNYKIWLNDGVY